MNRRRTILLAFAALPLVAAAQGRPARKIAFLGGGNAQTDAPGIAAFHEGMADLGWVHGKDYTLTTWYAENVATRLPELAAAVVATRPEVVLTTAEPPARALTSQSKIPVVFAIARDPIATGLAKTLHRPGGTATGLVTFAPELSAKRVQLLREAFPRVSHVAAIFATEDPVGLAQVSEIERAAREFGMRFTAIGIAGDADIVPAFARGKAAGADGFVVASGVMTSTNRKPIVDAAAQTRLPVIYPFDIFPLEGGLMSYGTRRTENYRRAAGYVDRILKGATPGELPIEQPTQIDLVINQQTAGAQGLAISPSVVLRADKIIK
jgi:putative ABC transport system substrate-binding protein